MTLPLKPSRGGFLRTIRCGLFIREYLSGNSPYGSPSLDPAIGAPQADIFHFYKEALRQDTAMDRATAYETKAAKKDQRSVSPDRISMLYSRYLARIPYKAQGARYHSFVVYFSNLVRLGWVESTGKEEPSALQVNYPAGQPRKYFRLTAKGMTAPDSEWTNPLAALYR